MAGALQGIKVLDLSAVWAVPGAGMYLADQGADVIRVEPPDGDDARRIYSTPYLGGDSRSFMVVNRNKRGIVVDIRTEQGKAIIYRLAGRSDVLLQNFRPGVAERLGYDYETLERINPRLIYVAVTPFGKKGPYAQRRAYDLIVQSLSGLLGYRSMPDGFPISAGVWAADCSGPMVIAYGVAMALYARERTGVGQRVEMALLMAAVAMQSVELVKVEADTHPREPYGQATYSPYRCADDLWLLVVIINDEEFLRLCQVLGVEEVARDPKFKDPIVRAQNTAELFPILEAMFRTRPRAEWLRLLEERDVACAPVLTREEVMESPQLVENEMIVEVEHPVVGKTRMMGIPVRLSKNPPEKIRPAPVLGQHTDQVLGELGYSAAEIATLRGSGVIA